MNVFDCAIKMEEEAKVSYEKMAAATAVPELKNLFTILAASEQEHHKALVKLKENISSENIQFNALLETACVFKPLLTKRDLMADLEDPDAYKSVVTQEEEGVRFYEDLAAQSENKEIRKILLLIADEEKKHLSIVENIYSFVESPKTYLAWGEFSNLKEY